MIKANTPEIIEYMSRIVEISIFKALIPLLDVLSLMVRGKAKAHRNDAIPVSFFNSLKCFCFPACEKCNPASPSGNKQAPAPPIQDGSGSAFLEL